MIQIKLLSGPHAGKAYKIPPAIAPGGFLHGIYLNDWLWEIDYSRATIIETESWMKHDVTLRCIRAFTKGLTVIFLNKTYLTDSSNKTKLKKVCLELEDAMVNSGKMISIDSDDERGVVIGVGRREN